MQSGAIPDSRIKATHSKATNPPYKARLRGASAWVLERWTARDWISIDLASVHKISALAIQGLTLEDKEGFISKYKVAYTTLQEPWTWIAQVSTRSFLGILSLIFAW